MEKEIKILNDKMSKMLEDISFFKIKIEELEKEIKMLKDDKVETGVYLDGCPDYAIAYINGKDKNKKEGE